MQDTLECPRFLEWDLSRARRYSAAQERSAIEVSEETYMKTVPGFLQWDVLYQQVQLAPVRLKADQFREATLFSLFFIFSLSMRNATVFWPCFHCLQKKHKALVTKNPCSLQSSKVFCALVSKSLKFEVDKVLSVELCSCQNHQTAKQSSFLLPCSQNCML